MKILMMTRIDKIWNELENDQSLQRGLLYQRLSGKIRPDIYVALKAPEKLRCIAAHFSSSLDFHVKDWDKFRDIKIQLLPDDKHPEKQFLIVLLLNNQHKDIFSSLCADLINKVAEITEESDLVKALISRLEKWHLLFEKLGQQGLSEQQQRGLYGELYFLRKFLEKVSDTEYCINSWKGPEKSVQDFQHSDWAVEVKTTHGKNQQKIHISSERQLDTALVSDIFLIHLSLDVRQNHGETLNDLVSEILEMLSNSPFTVSIFRLKLLEVGYFEIHKDLYNDLGYSIRQEHIYRVADDFPRITESMIPSGVGDVRYSLVVFANDDWTLNEKELFEQIIK